MIYSEKINKNMLFWSFVIISLSANGKICESFENVTFAIRDYTNANQISKLKSSTKLPLSNSDSNTSSTATTVLLPVSSKDPAVSGQSIKSTASQTTLNKSDSTSPDLSTVLTKLSSNIVATGQLIDNDGLTTNKTSKPELNVTKNSTLRETTSPSESLTTDQYRTSSNEIETTNSPKDVTNATGHKTTSVIKQFTGSTQSVETSLNSTAKTSTTSKVSTKKFITLFQENKKSTVEAITHLLSSEGPVKQTTFKKQTTTDEVVAETMKSKNITWQSTESAKRENSKFDKQTFCKDLNCGDGGKCVLKSDKVICECHWGRKGILCEVNLKPLITCVIVLASIFALVLILLLIQVIRQRRFAKWRIARFRSAKRDVYTNMPGSHRLVNAPSRSSKRRSDAGYQNLDDY